jgi:hypothetical protein
MVGGEWWWQGNMVVGELWWEENGGGRE